MNIKRRNFIKASGLVTTGIFIPGLLKAHEVLPANNTDKILIITQLTGGNDGLNTVVPYRNDHYYSARPQIAVPASAVLKLDDELGLNPRLMGFKSLYDAGKMAVLNNVGYPEPDRSHFRSMDIWHSASASDEYLSTGWIGRLLEEHCRNGSKPSYALELDDTLSLALKGADTKGLALKDPKRLYGSTIDPFISDLNRLHAEEHGQDQASYLYKTLAETISSAEYIYQTSRIYQSSKTYPDHALGKQLKTIAELIVSGLDTRVYYVSHGSFDTHTQQADKQGKLLGELGDAVNVFFDDLRSTGRDQDVLLMTFSEFGRRVVENASQGTDHGTANQVFLIGPGLKRPGIYNPGPNLDDLDEGDLRFTLDFRDLYATLLKQWLSTDPAAVLPGTHSLLNVI